MLNHVQVFLKSHFMVVSALAIAVGNIVAAPANFQIDVARSAVAVSGRVAGLTLQEQGPGSLSTRFEGIIKADVSDSTITFSGTSSIDALTNGVWEPGLQGASGTAPADFAGKASSFLGNVTGAARNIVLDVNSGALPLINGAFNATGLVFSFSTNSVGSLDYTSPLGSSSMSLTNLSASNIVNTASFTTTNGVQTLTIQVDTEYRFRLLSANDSNLRFVGQIVATVQSGPQLVSARLLDGKLIFEVLNASSSSRVESSTDLKTWTARTTDRSVVGNNTTITVSQLGSLEFFRLVE